MRDQTHQFTTDFYVESGEQFNLTELEVILCNFDVSHENITYSYLAHFKPLLFHLNIK